MRVTILRKVWTLLFTPHVHRNYDGWCDDPDVPRKSIRIRSTLRGQVLLETLLHELLHAADTHKNEEWVTAVAADLARILWRLNYRRMEDQPSGEGQGNR